MGITSTMNGDSFTVTFSEKCVYDQKDMMEIRKLIQDEIELPKQLNKLSKHLAKKHNIQRANIRQFIADGIPGMFGPVFQKMEQTVKPQSPEFYHFLTTNPLIQTFQELLFESKKNTIDSVFVRNYLATLSKEELQKHEPLVWAKMQAKQLSSITPVSSLQYSVTFQKEGENVVVKIQDEGIGQDILDAFKEQHDFKRHKDKFTGRDNIYGADQVMSEFGLRTGGLGKGARTEMAVLATLKAKKPIFSTNEEAPDGLGITIKYSHALNQENSLESKEPKETDAITIYTGHHDSQPKTSSTIKMIDNSESDSEETNDSDKEIAMLDVESLNLRSPDTETDRMETSSSTSEAKKSLDLSDLSDLSEIEISDMSDETPKPKSVTIHLESEQLEKPKPIIKPGGGFKKPMLTVLTSSKDNPDSPKPKSPKS